MHRGFIGLTLEDEDELSAENEAEDADEPAAPSAHDPSPAQDPLSLNLADPVQLIEALKRYRLSFLPLFLNEALSIARFQPSN